MRDGGRVSSASAAGFLQEAGLRIPALLLTGCATGARSSPSLSLSCLLAKMKIHSLTAPFVGLLLFGHTLCGSGWGQEDEQAQTQSFTDSKFPFHRTVVWIKWNNSSKGLVQSLLGLLSLTLNYI